MLKRAGLRQTKARVEILDYLIKRSAPVSVEDVQVAVAAHTVTVYRTLQEFSRVGIVYQTNFRSGCAYFEFQKQHHHHLICFNCGRREAVDTCLPKSWFRQVEQQSQQFEYISSHILEFFGRCKDCQSSDG